MLHTPVILAASLLYLLVLFAIAWFADQRAEARRSLIANPYIYTLSIAVYCTAWTFYGSVGRAAATGAGFLPIYLGPTLMAILWWTVLRKIIRITRAQRITSIADFIASRYGKSALLGGLVTVVAVVGILPYISLQLKAVSTSYQVLSRYPELVMPREQTGLWADTTLYVALLLAVFSIMFGARRIDATERHEGMVAAIAFESVIKLAAFVLVGAFVTFSLFDGPGDLFARAAAAPELARLMRIEGMPGGHASWIALTVLSMLAILFLPRQFQVAVVENVNEDHLRKAAWLFPLYLLAINVFVLPLAFGGVLLFPGGGVDPDTFVLTVPMAERQEGLALFVFIGGLSAATGMVIVATVAIATMVSNDLVIPLLLRIRYRALDRRADVSRLLLGIRRGTIVVVLLLGYLYFRLIGESYALVTIGLVSFCAAAQFAPPILLGIYWKGATRRGAIAGLCAGSLVWAYTLLLPGIALSGWLPAAFIEHGPFGIEALRPYGLFGVDDFDPITHALFWSMLANAGLLVGISLFSVPSPLEQLQANHFVDVFRRGGRDEAAALWRGTASVAELQALISRYLGEAATQAAFAGYARDTGVEATAGEAASPQLLHFAERLRGGAIGAASARIVISSVAKGEALSIDGVMEILDETSQVMEYSRRLEQKSRELETATRELREANERLQELDRLKDEFVSTVSHELRTPLTSIRAFSEILQSNPDLDVEQRGQFLDIVVKETERLSRLINDVLDLAKIESGRFDWRMETLDLNGVVRDSVAAVSQLFEERAIRVDVELPDEAVDAEADRDRLMQVVINLLSNAAKFCTAGEGAVRVRLAREGRRARIEVADNGPGIPAGELERVFEKFHQVSDQQRGKPEGSGLGLTISQRIVAHHGGRIEVRSTPGQGTTFSFDLATRALAQADDAAH